MAFLAYVNKIDLIVCDPKIPVYKGLGKTSAERQTRYKEWFKRDIPHRELSLIRNAVQKGGISGSRGFFDAVAKLAGRDVCLRPRGGPRKSL